VRMLQCGIGIQPDVYELLPARSACRLGLLYIS